MLWKESEILCRYTQVLLQPRSIMLMADSEELIGTTENDTTDELYKPMSL